MIDLIIKTAPKIVLILLMVLVRTPVFSCSHISFNTIFKNTKFPTRHFFLYPKLGK